MGDFYETVYIPDRGRTWFAVGCMTRGEEMETTGIDKPFGKFDREGEATAKEAAGRGCEWGQDRICVSLE